jgi:hypothetical protein
MEEEDGRNGGAPMKMIDLTGSRFSRLVALSPVHKRDPKGRPAIYWLCQCDCGKEAVVAGNVLRSGLTRSCGCLMAESRKARATKHGGVGTQLYTLWMNMRARCVDSENPAYANYGGRGIKVCNRWQTSFEDFREDVGHPPTPNHSLDRYPNNDGDYEPGNVRWATGSQQARNTRQSVFIELNGERLNLAEVAERYGIAYDTLHNRIKDGGWTPEQAVGLVNPPKRGGYKWGQGKRRRFDGSIREAGRER